MHNICRYCILILCSVQNFVVKTVIFFMGFQFFPNIIDVSLSIILSVCEFLCLFFLEPPHEDSVFNFI